MDAVRVMEGVLVMVLDAEGGDPKDADTEGDGVRDSDADVDGDADMEGVVDGEVVGVVDGVREGDGKGWSEGQEGWSGSVDGNTIGTTAVPAMVMSHDKVNLPDAARFWPSTMMKIRRPGAGLLMVTEAPNELVPHPADADPRSPSTANGAIPRGHDDVT